MLCGFGIETLPLKGRGRLKTHPLRLHISVRRDSLVIQLSIVVNHAEGSCGCRCVWGGDTDAKSPDSRN